MHQHTSSISLGTRLQDKQSNIAHHATSCFCASAPQVALATSLHPSLEAEYEAGEAEKGDAEDFSDQSLRAVRRIYKESAVADDDGHEKEAKKVPSHKVRG